MSVRFKNAAGLKTALNTVIGAGQDKASFSFRFKIHTPPDFTDGNQSQWILAKGNMVYFRMYKAIAGTATPQVYVRLGTVGGGAPSLTPIVYTNVVNHAAIVYDDSDPNGQALYVNGVKTLLGSPQNTALVTDNTTLAVGTTSDSSPQAFDCEMEDLLWWNGYAMTAADVLSLMNGTDPTTIGTGATWRGYWTLAGTTGAVPAIGDPGLVNQIDGTFPFTPYIGPTTPGTSLTYGAAMPLVSQTTFDTPIVCSSGESIRIDAKITATGAPITVTAGSATIMPTIKINGGLPITLERPFYTSSHYGILYFMPGGQKVPKGATVTFSAANGFFASSLGTAGAVTDIPTNNRSGKPIYGDLPPTIRVGINFDAPASRYWGYEQCTRDYYIRLQTNRRANPSVYRADGTFNTYTVTQLINTSYDNPVDGTGTPMLMGDWAFGWKNNNISDPVTIVPVSMSERADGVAYVERTEYRNTGDGTGENQVRVYTVATKSWTPNLAVSCDSSSVTLTLDSVAGLVGGSPAKQWIKIDNEYMPISTVTTATKQITVARGGMGTTAASHTAGAACLVKYFSCNPGMRLQINSTSGNPNYSNPVIYDPTGWTKPGTPGPVTLDKSDAARKQINQLVADTLANGVGCTRHMGDTLAFMACVEPEQMRKDTDPYWGADDGNSLRQFRIVEVHPYDPASSPYFYSHVEGATYPATLGANITTAPAAGTVETITITDAATAKVMMSSRLILPSGEILRVLSVSGTSVQIVRGAERTTPATQAAGPILVRGRIAITSASQYASTNNAAAEFTTDVDHGLMPGMWISNQSCSDIIPAARFPVTLGATINTSQTTFAVTMDSGNWQYVVTGLHLFFDGEDMTVVSGNQGAGTVTVTRASGSNAKTHTSGTVGASGAPGPLCVSADGTKKAWHNKMGWNIAFQVTGPRTLYLPCSVDMGGQVGSIAGTQVYDQTPQLASNGTDKTLVRVDLPTPSYSYEHTARVTRQSPGAWHWMNLPLSGSNDVVDAAAVAVRDNLPVGQHKVIVELGNEIWNTTFPFYLTLVPLSMTFGYASWQDWWVLRTKQVVDRVKAVFAETGRSGEILLALPWQTGNSGTALARARALGVDVDVMSTAPYFTPGNTQAHYDAYNGGTNGQRNDLWLFDMELWSNGGAGAALRGDKLSKAAHEAAVGHSIEYICYEGGANALLPIPPNGQGNPVLTNGFAMNFDVNYDPNRYFVETDYYYLCQKLGGCTGINIFEHCHAPQSVAAGTGAWWAFWGVLGWHGQQAGYGDGSDGKFDNRTLLATPGLPNSKDPTVNQAQSVVSPRMQAFLNYQAAYQSGIIPPPPNVDVPHRITAPSNLLRRIGGRPIALANKLKAEPTPPPPPAPVPKQGRRATAFRLTIS